MATSRRAQSRELLPDGRILVVGGTNTTGVDESASVFYNTAEIYDPATGTWTATGSLTTGRALAQASRLPDGRIILSGGWWVSLSAEIYNPATGTWSATGHFNGACGAQRYMLFDGRIMVAGGFDSSEIQSRRRKFMIRQRARGPPPVP
jgi:N-acetylneuraminic acid mutarotase